MGFYCICIIFGGKLVQFFMIGVVIVKYYISGEMIEVDKIKYGECIVIVDDLFIFSQFIVNIDEVMNYYDVCFIYFKEVGYVLVNIVDKNIVCVIVKAVMIDIFVEAVGLSGGVFDDEVFINNVIIGFVGFDVEVGVEIVCLIYAVFEEFDKKDIIGEKVCVFFFC